ncbi:PREDICTED: AP-1 complex subunit sigma-2 isoform X3 [Condylura cristata]|uniref:AP-1 complex subunit sigma-2 isoform X3 n=1 Tax=Condylura cristata TaxID=143302 RepID=UPI00064286A4|nr:PREDICTED: AP-1 complex subunit sigma-2 isoform X3 [Condylura cristata]
MGERIRSYGAAGRGFIGAVTFERKSLAGRASRRLDRTRPLKARGTRGHFLCRELSQMQFMLLFSRQGKLRLQKWYVPLSDKEKKKITRELVQTVLARKPKMCSFLEWRDLKIVYKRYASLYFCCAIEDQDNELITLEIIHRYVELLDKYFGSVCELDIIFNFEKAYFILDEFLLGGEVQETSKKNVLKAIEQADLLQEEAETPRSVLEEIGLT